MYDHEAELGTFYQDDDSRLIEAISEAVYCVEDAKAVPAEVVAVLLRALDVEFDEA
jgi:hypothetical protein